MPSRSYSRQLSLPHREVTLLIRRQRRKSMALHVLPGDVPVELRVPLNCPWYAIDAFLESRLAWLAKALDKVEQIPVEPLPRYIEGESHQYLGESKPLKIHAGRGTPFQNEEGIHLHVKDPNDAAGVEKKLLTFYKTQALPFFEARLPINLERFTQRHARVRPGQLSVRKMRARWGSCSRRGDICLNTMLMKKPIAAIDFVITHELCHLEHFHHGPAFYQLMDLVMPDWRVSEALLGPGSTHQF